MNETDNKSRPFKMTDLLQSDAEFIPLISPQDEDEMYKEEVPSTLPILALRNTVLFPGVVIPITVGRDKSIALIKDSYRKGSLIGVSTQRDGNTEDPGLEDLYHLGTMARILKTVQMPDGNTTVIIQGRKRFVIDSLVQLEPYMVANVSACESETFPDNSKTFSATISSVKDLALQIIRKSSNLPAEAAVAIGNIESPAFLLNFISSNMNLGTAEKQRLLEQSNMLRKAQDILTHLTNELQMVDLKMEIQNKVKGEIDKQQRDYMLQQQMKTIQEELGVDPNKELFDELLTKALNMNWSKEVEETFFKELRKFQRMHQASAEFTLQLNYLETLLALPWNVYSKDQLDIKRARKVLDHDHFGLEKVKERLLEYLAVLKLKGNMKSPILCLVGPPGVGKTSLGKSLAKAMGRKYIRMSLGGLHDEAEIRGHRKTYIGAMPGRIIQNLKKAKTSNPVFVLDEIDKVAGSTFHGDPASALLEVLDPEQNKAFYDNFLELEYDLSNVMFVATANTMSSIHPALRDRFEVIEISGYLQEEKLQIAKNHLVPKQLADHGLKKKDFRFSDEFLEALVDNYTRESGVRGLEKLIAKVIRYSALQIAEGVEEYNKKPSPADLKAILGPAPFSRDKASEQEMAGVVTGLAWTAVGGEILYVEASLSKGEGRLTLTGSLGDVMKESATLAFEYIKAHAHLLDIAPEVFKSWNVHIHVPEGATPKDGPSAGVTMITALASVFTQRKVRPALAMTGEITLRGKVLPVGGIKEKILAARRASISDIILPATNKKDIEDILPVYLTGLTFHYVEQMSEVIEYALLSEKVKNPINIG
jgi:ATP-dependent Lon protease